MVMQRGMCDAAVMKTNDGDRHDEHRIRCPQGKLDAVAPGLHNRAPHPHALTCFSETKRWNFGLWIPFLWAFLFWFWLVLGERSAGEYIIDEQAGMANRHRTAASEVSHCRRCHRRLLG